MITSPDDDSEGIFGGERQMSREGLRQRERFVCYFVSNGIQGPPAPGDD